MDRAYSALHVKDIKQDADFVYLSGIASTPTVDRVGDIVEPMGAKYRTPLPLLVGHDHSKQVGHMTAAKLTKSGIPFDARIPIIKEAGELKNLVDRAIHALKYNLLGFVSIGFKPDMDKTDRIDTGFRFKEWSWLELSLCSIPANPDAVVAQVKSMDMGDLLSLDVIQEIKRYDVTASKGGIALLKPAPIVQLQKSGSAVKLIK
jgi:HK97 family phage prohead protease